MAPKEFRPYKNWFFGCLHKFGPMVSLAFIMGFAVSCVSSKPAISVITSQPEKPTWIDVLPHSQERIFFQGISSYSETLKEGTEKARMDAFSKISEYLGTSIESSFESFASNSESHASSTVRSNSESNIVGATLEDTYHVKRVRQAGALNIEKFDVYVLFSYSKSRAEKEIKRKENEKRKRVISAHQLLKKGQTLEKAAKYNMAMESYKKAIPLLQGLEMIAETASEKIDSNLLLVTIANRMEAIKEINSRICISVRVQGSPEKKDVFMANLKSALTEQGFSVTGEKPCYKIVANIRTSKVGYTLNNYVFLASGKISAMELSTDKEIATVAVSSKGFHKIKTQSALNSLEEAGLSAGKEIAEKIKHSINFLRDKA